MRINENEINKVFAVQWTNELKLDEADGSCRFRWPFPRCHIVSTLSDFKCFRHDSLSNKEALFADLIIRLKADESPPCCQTHPGSHRAGQPNICSTLPPKWQQVMTIKQHCLLNVCVCAVIARNTINNVTVNSAVGRAWAHSHTRVSTSCEHKKTDSLHSQIVCFIAKQSWSVKHHRNWYYRTGDHSLK